MALSINLNKDFDWVKSPCLFYFRSEKFYHVKETHMLLVAFWRTLVKIFVVFQHKRQRNKSFSRFADNLKRPTRTWKSARCTMQMNYSYASDGPDCLSKNFCKVAKRAETARNYQNRFWLWLTIFWQTHKLTRYRSKQFSYRTFREQTQKFTCITSRRADFIHSQREIKEIIDSEKHTFSIKSEHKSTQKSSGSSSLPYSLPSLWKIGKRISQLPPFHHITWQHPHESPRHVRGSARIYDVRMAQFVLKIEKLSHIMGPRASQDLRSPSLIMAPGDTL